MRKSEDDQGKLLKARGGGVGGVQPFFSSSVLWSSSASSAVFTRMRSGMGQVGFLSSMTGFGTHTTITLFLPTREHGMDADTMMLSRMFPEEERKGRGKKKEEEEEEEEVEEV